MELTIFFFEERRITTPFSAQRLAAESDFHTARRINGDDRKCVLGQLRLAELDLYSC